MKDYDKARKYYLECLKSDSKYKDANERYSFLLYEKGDIESALEYVEKELRIRDPNMYMIFNYGYFNHLLGNKIESEKGIKQAIKLIETIEDKDKLLKALRINESDQQSLEFLNRFKECLEHKFE